MFETLFQNTVSALCYELAGDQGACDGGIAWEDGEPLGPPYNDVAGFVIRQHGSMPQVLGAGVRLATIAFGLSSMLRNGTLFHRLAPVRRRLQVAGWTASRLGPCRDLMRLYNSLVILALYSRPGCRG